MRSDHLRNFFADRKEVALVIILLGLVCYNLRLHWANKMEQCTRVLFHVFFCASTNYLREVITSELKAFKIMQRSHRLGQRLSDKQFENCAKCSGFSESLKQKGNSFSLTSLNTFASGAPEEEIVRRMGYHQDGGIGVR